MTHTLNKVVSFKVKITKKKFRVCCSWLFFFHQFWWSFGLQMLHCSIPSWFWWSSRSEQHFTSFNSGRQFSMSANMSLKALNSKGLKQSPFLVGTMSDSSFGFQYCRISTQGFFLSHGCKRCIPDASFALRSCRWFPQRSS